MISTIFGLLILQISVSANKYCANIVNEETQGASGYYALEIEEGVAQHQMMLDLSQFTTTCNLTQGLTYHIHSYWTGNTNTSASGASCGAGFTGGHYDPNFACSAASQNITDGCIDLGRVAADNYTYTCTPELYSENRYSYCEVGDTGGKSGKLYSDDMIFQLTQPFQDYQPPYIANYLVNDQNSLMWSSVVFHCAETGARLVCAKFSDTEADFTDECTSAFSSFPTESSDSSDDISQSKFNMAVVLSAVLCFIGGIAVGAWVVPQCCGKSEGKQSLLSKV